MASFVLALIGLKKFRSFQKPNRIDVLEKKTRRLGAGPGVAGSVAESRESGERLQAGLGAQRRKVMAFRSVSPAGWPWRL